VIVAVFRRRLKDGKSFEDVRQAREAEQGFGAPTRVRAMYRLATEHDLTGAPRQVEVGSVESLLRPLVEAPPP
jgi:hypothetical protein